MVHYYIQKMKAGFTYYFLLFLVPLNFLHCSSQPSQEKIEDQTIIEYSGDIKLIQSTQGSNKTIFVLTGFGQSPDSIINKHQLFKSLLRENHDLAFVSITNKNQTLYVKQEEIKSLAEQITAFIANSKESKKTYTLLGFSIGGSACLKLLSDSVFCNKTNISKCVVIDPPLDIERLYSSLLRQHKATKNDISKNESDFLLNFFKENYNITETTKPPVLWSNSIFALNDTLYKNHKRIKHKNILLFTNNDSTWQRVNRGRLPIDMNITDCISFYESIRMQNNAKMIVMKNNNALSNPHSWDNVDESILINWLQ